MSLCTVFDYAPSHMDADDDDRCTPPRRPKLAFARILFYCALIYHAPPKYTIVSPAASIICSSV